MARNSVYSPLRRALVLIIVGLALLAMVPSASHATSTEVRDGWAVLGSPYSFENLVKRVEFAASDHGIGIVTRASATIGAKRALDVDIPGNMVMGLFHPRFAVRMLAASISAGIEAPIRLYLTENDDGTTTLSYKIPSHVFAPYMDEGGAELGTLANELDELFSSLTGQAVGTN